MINALLSYLLCVIVLPKLKQGIFTYFASIAASFGAENRASAHSASAEEGSNVHKKGGASRVSCVFTVVLLNVPNAIKDKP